MYKHYNRTVDRAPQLIVLSGAGLSADSGISTFRGSTGLWEDHDVDQVANGLTWKKNWDIVRQFYNNRRIALNTVQPNAMHLQIANWQSRYPVVTLTQNIDDLLERAGCTNVIHLHGELTMMRCNACGHEWNVEYAAVEADDRCTSDRCNSLKGVRPKVVFFNESAPEYRKLYNAFKQLQAYDCVVVIGTSGLVIDVNSILFDCPAHKILNNLETSDYINESYFDHVVFGKAAEQTAYIDTLVTAHMNKG